ncbi:MAG: FAD-binding oxidoreductase [Pseudomonadota bacterium]
MKAETKHINSWYAASANPIKMFPQLEGEYRADVCVVGGGITGLSGALHLAEAGFSVILLEAKCVGWGASGRSGGQMIFGYSCDLDEFENTLGEKAADKLWDASLEGMKLIRKLIRKHNIECDFQPGHAHVAVKPKHMRELEEWHADLIEYEYEDLELWDQTETRNQIASDRYIGAMYDPNSAHMHPLNYTLGLANAVDSLGVQIFEQSEVTSIQPGQSITVKTDTGQVSADFCLLAGNGYMSGILPEIESRIVIEPSYVIATAPLGEALSRELIPNNIAFADVNVVLDYCRMSSDHRLIFGGQVAHWPWQSEQGLTESMRKQMLKIFPQLKEVPVEYSWSGNMAYTWNEAPDLGRAGHNLYYAHGFSGHGIATTGLAGKIIAQAINGQAKKFDLFTQIQHRTIPKRHQYSRLGFALDIMLYRLKDKLPF